MEISSAGELHKYSSFTQVVDIGCVLNLRGYLKIPTGLYNQIIPGEPTTTTNKIGFAPSVRGLPGLYSPPLNHTLILPFGYIVIYQMKAPPSPLSLKWYFFLLSPLHPPSPVYILVCMGRGGRRAEASAIASAPGHSATIAASILRPSKHTQGPSPLPPFHTPRIFKPTSVLHTHIHTQRPSHMYGFVLYSIYYASYSFPFVVYE